MLRLASIALLLASPSVAVGQDAVAEPDYEGWTSEDWRSAAQEDVREAYAHFIQNHPGLHDPQNPDFPSQLAKARVRGLEAASLAQDRYGYARALAAFSAVLSDGHALVIDPWATAGTGEPEWPGFVALWRDDALYVRTIDPDDPAHGARITSCDGMPIREFLLDRLSLYSFRPGEAGQWWARPSQLFYAHTGVTRAQPKSCRFVNADGSDEVHDLNWRALSESENTFRRNAMYGDAEPIALTQPREGIFFIGLQDFRPDADGVAEYENLYADVEARRGELLSARALVLDLRRNNGGSSRWSERLAQLLWGKASFEARSHASPEVQWRSSPDNIAHMEQVAARLREEGDAELASWVDRLTAGMRRSNEGGEPLFAQSVIGSPTPNERPEWQSSDPTTDFETPVYVITSGNCASACLDALDFCTLYPNVRFIGAPTSADSTYMDARVAHLSSGPGEVVIPVKVYVGRNRGWGEIYEPDIVMTDLDWSTQNFLDWIERDLSGI